MTITTRIALVAATAAVAAATGTVPASASTPRGPEAAAPAASAYADPLAALGGRTLAQYLTDHHAAGTAGGVGV